MAAGSPRRPRTTTPPPPDNLASPPVSELSTSDVATGDGSSSSIRDYDVSRSATSGTTAAALPVTAAALSTLTNENGNNSDSGVGSAASSVVEEDEDDIYTDSGSERSASDTYYLDMGGEAVRDQLGWQDVVKQADIRRTYASDEEDGGACPYVDPLADLGENNFANNNKQGEEEVIEIEPTPVVDVDIDEKGTSPVQILEDPNVDTLLDSDEVKGRSVDSDSYNELLPVSIERRERADTLLAGEDIDEDSSENEEIVSRGKGSTRKGRDNSLSASGSDDSVVAVDLSDGEEVLPDDSQDEIPAWARGAQDLTPADLHKALAETAATEDSPSSNTISGRESKKKKKKKCGRRRYLTERLRTVRTALQMVQIETAAMSAEAQLNGGCKGEGSNDSQKTKYKKELAALCATLDFLAKMALQRAIETENRQDTKPDTCCSSSSSND